MGGTPLKMLEKMGYEKYAMVRIPRVNTVSVLYMGHEGVLAYSNTVAINCYMLRESRC